MKIFFLVLFLSIAAGILNFLYLLPPVVNWDEGTHGLWGFREWLALRDGSWSAFWQFTRQQFAYPPLGSWLIALINYPFEFSLTLARFVSTIGFIISAALIYLIGKQLRAGSNSKYVGLTALFLFMTSPIILFYSVAVFKEIWGVTLTLFFFFLYFRAYEKRSYRLYFWAGMSLALLFFEKYNYAGLVFLTLVLETIVEWVVFILNFSLERKILQEKIKLGKKIIFRQALLFSPLLIFASWWILTPDNKLTWFLDIMRSDWNPVTVGLGNRIDYLLFYPNSLRASYVFSEALFWLLAGGYLLSIKDFAGKKIRTLFLLFTLNLILGTEHAINLQDRYILTTVPALFLVVGFETEKLFFNVKYPMSNIKCPNNYGFIVRGFSLVVFVVLVSLDFMSLPQFLKSNATHLLSSAMYNEKDYRDTIFNFNKNEWPRLSRSSGPWSLVVGQIIGDKRLMTNDYQTSEQVVDYILENIDVNKPVEIVGHTSEISPDWIELRWALRRRECKMKNVKCDINLNINSYLVTLEVKPTSRLNTYDYKRANSWTIPKIKEITETNKNNLFKEKDFAELGLIVRIYGF